MESQRTPGATNRPGGGSRSYEPIADRYEQARGGDDRARRIASAVLPWLDGVSTVCDVGVGTGIIARRLEASGLLVVGFDLSARMLRQAAERLPGRVVRADAAAMPLKAGSFDAALFVWVLHHVGDLPAALSEAARLVRAGGRIVAVSGFADPVGDDIDPIMRTLDDDLRPDRWTHGDAVAAAAAAAGLRHDHTGTAVVEFVTSPEGLASSIEERMYSTLWDLDESTWQTVVAPKVTALRRLPRPNEPRLRVVPHPLWVWSRA